MHSKNVLLALLVLLLFFSGAVSFFAPSSSVKISSAQSSTCPANQVLKFGYDAGAPNSANFLTAGGSGLQVAMLNYLSMYPPFSPTGQPDYNMSIINWYTVSSNQSQWTFNIKPGLMWSNGQPVTSQDILATYSNKFAFNATYDFTGDHNEVASEKALNSSAVQFNLTKPDAEFGDTISIQVLTAVYPASYINQYGPAYNYFNAPTDGPYYMVNYTVGASQMVMLRNPYFHPAPAACELDVSFVEGLPQVSTLLTGGTVDYGLIDPASAASLLATPNLHIMDQKAAAIEDLNYNITQYPFNMTQFRQALAYGINQSQVVQQADFGYGLTAYKAEGTIPPTVSSYNPNQVSYSYNQTQSLALLQSIGIKKGSSGQLQYPNGTAVTITLWGENSEPGAALATGVVAANLQSLGFTVTEHISTFSDIYGMTSVQPGSMYLVANTGAVFPDPLVDVLPGWDVYEIPPVPSSTWESPASAQAMYESNITALESSGNSTATATYVNNIQAINAQYLPTLVVGYEDSLWGYSTARWTNWPSFPQHWFHYASIPDDSLFSYLTPVGSSSTTSAVGSTSTTSSSATTTLPTTSSATSTATSITTTSSTTSSTTGSSSISTTDLAAIAVIVVIVIVAAAALMTRRRKG